MSDLPSKVACGFRDFLRACGLGSYVQPCATSPGGSSTYVRPTRIVLNAMAAYDGLNQSPDTEVNFQVQTTSGLVNRSTSVAKLGFLDVSTFNQGGSDIERLIGELLSDGVITKSASGIVSGENGSGAGHYKAYKEPTKLVQFPYESNHIDVMDESGASNNSLALPQNWPVPRGFTGIYPTDKMFDGRAYPSSRLVSVMERMAAAVSKRIIGGNGTCWLEPTLIGAAQPRDAVSPDYNPPVNDSLALMKEDRSLWSSSVEVAQALPGYYPSARDNFMPQMGWSLPAPSSEPERDYIVVNGSSNPLWMRSLELRKGLKADNSGPGGPYANAVMDIMRLLQAAIAIIEVTNTSQYSQGSLVTLNACTTVFNICHRRAFTQLGLSFGSNVSDFENAIAQEADARKVAARRNALGLTGARFSVGGDAAQDISAALTSTLALAISISAAAGPFAAIAAVVVLAILGIVSWQTSTAAPLVSPTQRRLIVAPMGASLQYMTPKQAIQGWPCSRIRAKV